jgi:hypothetical protein
MYHHLYLRNGTVYLPIVGKMGKGFYRDIEPVIVTPVANTEGLRKALEQTVARGNPDVPILRRRELSAPVVLKYAGVKSWAAFQRGLLLWGIEKKNGIWQIMGKRKKPDGATVDDAEQTITFPLGSKIDDVIERLIAIIQQAARKPS